MIVPLAIIGIAILVTVAVVISRPKPVVVERQEAAPLVDAIKVVKQTVQLTVRAQGVVAPRTSTVLASEVAGQVVVVADNFEVGGYARAGELLLRIDDSFYQAEVKRAEAALANAERELAEEKGRAEVAFRDWQDYHTTVERGMAGEALALRKPQLNDAQAKLEAVQADLDYARTQLAKTVIRAPYDSLIRRKDTAIGEYVTVGGPLVELFAIDTAEVRLPLPDNKIGAINLPPIDTTAVAADQPKIRLTATLGEQRNQWVAHLVRTEGVIDERSHVLFVVAAVNDPYGLRHGAAVPLRVGTFIDAEIVGKQVNDVVVLPRTVLRVGRLVWVIDNQSRLHSRELTLMNTEGDTMVVSAGLHEGDKVCLCTMAGAVPGTLVRIADTIPSTVWGDAMQQTEQNQ